MRSECCLTLDYLSSPWPPVIVTLFLWAKACVSVGAGPFERAGIQFVVVPWAYYCYWFGTWTGQVLGCRRTQLLDVRTGGGGGQ